MIKLKPCPFCGGEANVKQYGNNFDAGCANILKCQVISRTYGYPTAEEAAEAWNTRADDAYSDDGK